MWLYTHIIISSSCTSRWCKWKKILFWMFVLMSNSVAWFSFNNLENHLIYYRRASKFLEFFKTIYQIWNTWRIINDWKIVQPHKNFSIFYAIKNFRKKWITRSKERKSKCGFIDGVNRVWELWKLLWNFHHIKLTTRTVLMIKLFI